MLLRNKKTGEIDDFIFEVIKDRIDLYKRVGYSETKNVWRYNSLAELNEEWEDYKEPREYWYIDYDGGILCGESDNSSAEKMMISMGNHFKSLKEAEKAVEKLKAWKRLEEARICFKDYHYELEENDALITYKLEIESDGFAYEDFTDDLNLLFGGEDVSK